MSATGRPLSSLFLFLCAILFPFNFSTKEAVSLPANAPSRPIRAGIISHTQSAHHTRVAYDAHPLVVVFAVLFRLFLPAHVALLWSVREPSRRSLDSAGGQQC
jgi:hypothetical protein